jgi:hypothetical protein
MGYRNLGLNEIEKFDLMGFNEDLMGYHGI